MKYLSRSLETSPFLTSQKETSQKQGSKYGVNLNISLITVSHMASCNLRNSFLEVLKLA